MRARAGWITDRSGTAVIAKKRNTFGDPDKLQGQPRGEWMLVWMSKSAGCYRVARANFTAKKPFAIHAKRSIVMR